MELICQKIKNKAIKPIKVWYFSLELWPNYKFKLDHNKDIFVCVHCVFVKKCKIEKKGENVQNIFCMSINYISSSNVNVCPFIYLQTDLQAFLTNTMCTNHNKKLFRLSQLIILVL